MEEDESEDEVFSDITTVSEDLHFETSSETDTDCTLMVIMILSTE